MRRLLALLLAALLCFCCPTIAEEAAVGEGDAGAGTIGMTVVNEPEPTFSDLLAEWLGKLDPSRADIRAALSYLSEEYTALLREDGGLMEVDVPGLGKLQLSDGDLALNAGDQTYVLEFGPLLDAVRSFGDSSRETAEKLVGDMEALNQLMRQAVEAIILPSASISYGYRGVNAHFELNQEDLRERLDGFIDAQIDGEAFGRLFEKCVPYLRMVMSDFPDSPEALHKSWKAVAPLLRWLIPDFSIEADAQIGIDAWRGPQVALVGRVTSFLGRTGFSLDYAPDDDGFSFAASLDRYGGRSDNFNLSASLDLHGGHLTGALLADGYEAVSYALDAWLTEDGVNAGLTYRRGSELTWETSLYLWQDVEGRTLTGSLDFTDYEYGEPVTANLASLNARFWDSGCSGALIVPGQSVNFRVTASSGTTHVSVRTLPDDSYDCGNSIDVWVFRQQWSGYRARCEYRQSQGGRRSAEYLLTGTISPSEIAFGWFDVLRGTSVEGGAHYINWGEGFDLGYSFNVDAQRYYRSTLQEKPPFSVNISFDGENCKLTFSNSDSYEFIRGSAQFTLDENGCVSRLEGEYTAGDLRRSADATAVRFTYTPEKMTVSGGDEAYTIERTACSERELAYAMTGNQDGVAYTARLALDEGLNALTVEIAANGEVVAALRISAAEKTAVEPLDRENAVPVGMDMLRALLNPQPEETEVVIRDPEAAEDPEQGKGMDEQ